MKNIVDVLDTFRCKCIYEPRGAYGLEGYVRGLDYMAQKVSLRGKNHMRVYPTVGLDYFETCSVMGFNRFFLDSP